MLRAAHIVTYAPLGRALVLRTAFLNLLRDMFNPFTWSLGALVGRLLRALRDTHRLRWCRHMRRRVATTLCNLLPAWSRPRPQDARSLRAAYEESMALSRDRASRMLQDAMDADVVPLAPPDTQ